MLIDCVVLRSYFEESYDCLKPLQRHLFRKSSYLLAMGAGHQVGGSIPELRFILPENLLDVNCAFRKGVSSTILFLF